MNIPDTTFFNPFGVDLDLEQGLMNRAKNHVIRRASDMRGYYADEGALNRLVANQKNPVHYEVFEVPVPEEHGNLMYCISTLQPGRVGDEWFMTKGHYHSVPDTAEIYLSLRGEGYMMMKIRDGKCVAERMKRGRMVYVLPFWAYRSINIAACEPLVSFCVYPAEAGHNYGDIVTEGFPKRIFARNGECVIE